MILSRTTQYAIQALIYMAMQPPGVTILTRTIAGHLNSPPTYLAKILQELCRSSLLYSFRGKQGGFCLRENSDQVTLMQIARLTEGMAFMEGCVLGLRVCSDRTACPMHVKWLPIRQEIMDLLQGQTLGMLAARVASGRYRLTDLPAVILEDPRLAT
ncbi:Rrf2 family transcriptional regulator [Nitrosovibrio sp. Nv17]|jgi:Rrf2 family protein|uniref:RrF2 family transcriptional regulator n=1 Tax=Nitrosovibrio sp. Nv17 TaxID=1855339 RepID=UPI000908A25C|nr:Rrf2 family transcriptional regulator [Nitrosovibrio sp. Nv17]SFW40511.1 transcriptional regulator, BadM/Rrf2 family [Nitrosovibrio sp. Nv17]